MKHWSRSHQNHDYCAQIGNLNVHENLPMCPPVLGIDTRERSTWFKPASQKSTHIPQDVNSNLGPIKLSLRCISHANIKPPCFTPIQSKMPERSYPEDCPTQEKKYAEKCTAVLRYHSPPKKRRNQLALNCYNNNHHPTTETAQFLTPPYNGAHLGTPQEPFHPPIQPTRTSSKRKPTIKEKGHHCGGSCALTAHDSSPPVVYSAQIQTRSFILRVLWSDVDIHAGISWYGVNRVKQAMYSIVMYGNFPDQVALIAIPRSVEIHVMHFAPGPALVLPLSQTHLKTYLGPGLWPQNLRNAPYVKLSRKRHPPHVSALRQSNQVTLDAAKMIAAPKRVPLRSRSTGEASVPRDRSAGNAGLRGNTWVYITIAVTIPPKGIFEFVDGDFMCHRVIELHTEYRTPIRLKTGVRTPWHANSKWYLIVPGSCQPIL